MLLILVGDEMNYYYGEAENFYIQRQEKKKEIRRLGLLIGGAFLLYIILQSIISLIFQLTGLLEKYDSDPIYSSALDTLIIIASLLVPFYFMGKGMRKISCVREPLSLEKPSGGSEFILAVVAGAGACMLANIVTSYITLFIEAFGIHLKSPDIAMPTGIMGVVITIVRVVVCAAMAEEIAMRGYIMGNLRPYGDKFAILISSLMFAVMHGNLVQAPFALMAGFAIGYFSIKTGSMWTGIAIHALNNAISVIITYASDYLSQEKAAVISAVTIYGLIAVGAVSFIAFKNLTKERGLTDNCTVLSLREKCMAFILSPTVLISFVYMIYITLHFIEIG